MFPDIPLPPAIYDHEPEGVYYILELPKKRVSYLCRGHLACAFPKRRLVVIPEGLIPSIRDKLLRHELAHLNGWIE